MKIENIIRTLRKSDYIVAKGKFGKWVLVHYVDLNGKRLWLINEENKGDVVSLSQRFLYRDVMYAIMKVKYATRGTEFSMTDYFKGEIK